MLTASNSATPLPGAMEKNPWYKNVEGPYLQWKGPVGVKEDGGGSTRGRGRIGPMVVHRAACNRDTAGVAGIWQ